MTLMDRLKNSPKFERILSVRAQVYENGFAFVQRLLPQTDSFHVAAALGKPLQLGGDQIVQRLVPLSASTPNTYSGNYGLNPFPFHTDLAHWNLPPRYFMLRCVKGYSDVPTLILDGNKLISDVGSEILRRAVVRPRRPRAGEVRLLRLLAEGLDAQILRWDSLYLKPASRIGEKAFADVHDSLDSITPIAVALVQEGDTMVIDNWRMLHGRSAVMENYSDRHLERVYLGTLN
jgi:L-asparagine oxygenase